MKQLMVTDRSLNKGGDGMDSRTKLSVLHRGGGADPGETKILGIGEKNDTNFI